MTCYYDTKVDGPGRIQYVPFWNILKFLQADGEVQVQDQAGDDIIRKRGGCIGHLKERVGGAMKICNLLLCLIISLTVCSCSNARIKEYSDAEQKLCMDNSDLVYEGTIEKIVNVGRGDLFKAQAQEKHPDLRWLIIFKITKILKGSYQYDELGMTVHSPTLSFGTYLFQSDRKSVV